MFSLCLELQCVNQVIGGCVMFVLSIWMCAVEHTKSITLDGKLTVNSFIENSQEKMRCLLEYCTVCLEKPGFTHSRTKRADLFIVCYRSAGTSVADLQTIYR